MLVHSRIDQRCQVQEETGKKLGKFSNTRKKERGDVHQANQEDGPDYCFDQDGIGGRGGELHRNLRRFGFFNLPFSIEQAMCQRVQICTRRVVSIG